MTNPYKSSVGSSREISQSPTWYVWFYKAYWPAWWTGTALIALSWFEIVTPTVGWIGFTLAGTAALGSYVLPSLAGVVPEDLVILDSRLLNSRSTSYHNAIERFRNGALLMFDGVVFGFRPNDEIACSIVTDVAELDERTARELADHAQAVFEELCEESIEFKSAVNGQTFRVSIMSGTDQSARELCRVVDDRLEWRRV